MSTTAGHGNRHALPIPDQSYTGLVTYDAKDADSAFAPIARVDATAAMIFSADDTCDVGSEGGALVTPDYGIGSNRFTGTVSWVQIDIAEAAHDDDHRIAAEERVRVAMARQ